MFSYKYKKLVVKHTQRVDAMRELLEQRFQKRFHAMYCNISNGEVALCYYGEWKHIPFMQAVLRDLISGEAPLPSNWTDIASQFCTRGLTIEQTEQHLQCSILEVPQNFFDYCEGLLEYMAENAEDPYYLL